MSGQNDQSTNKGDKMSKKHLIAITLIALAFSSLSWAQIDKIALFTEAVSWTDVATAEAAAEYIMNNVESASTIEVYSDADIATFAEDNTNDGNVDIIITFGYFPVSLYTPGNSEVDVSVGEMFLEGGDIFLNTADYIFYVTEGGGANGDTGLKNMTDSNLDMWTDGTQSAPTADGETYTPSLIEFEAPRCFQMDQVDDDPDWEVEAVFGSDGGNNLDPVIIRNLTYGGRVGIAFQAGGTAPRAEVLTEMIDNYLGPAIPPETPGTAVEFHGKLPLTWGHLKSD
jgi:hypothetical protein